MVETGFAMGALNANISLNIQNRKTCDISKNSPLWYLFVDVGYHFLITRHIKSTGR